MANGIALLRARIRMTLDSAHLTSCHVVVGFHVSCSNFEILLIWTRVMDTGGRLVEMIAP
jgi:hypothetical protein